MFSYFCVMKTYRKINLVEDYPVLKGFWEKGKMKVAPSISFLPQDAMVVQDGEMRILGALFFYTPNNSYTAISGFPIFDSEYDESDRDELIEGLYEHVETMLRYNGYKHLFTTMGLPHVKARLKHRGYISADKNVDTFIKPL